MNENCQHHGVRVVGADSIEPDTAQIPDIDRKAAIDLPRGGASALWAGAVHIHLDAKTGAHHHGPFDSVIYEKPEPAKWVDPAQPS